MNALLGTTYSELASPSFAQLKDNENLPPVEEEEEGVEEEGSLNNEDKIEEES